MEELVELIFRSGFYFINSCIQEIEVEGPNIAYSALFHLLPNQFSFVLPQRWNLLKYNLKQFSPEIVTIVQYWIKWKAVEEKKETIYCLFCSYFLKFLDVSISPCRYHRNLKLSTVNTEFLISKFIVPSVNPWSFLVQ